MLFSACSFVHAMLRFLAPKPKTDDRQEKVSAMVQHLKATVDARNQSAKRAAYSKAGASEFSANTTESTKC